MEISLDRSGSTEHSFRLKLGVRPDLLLSQVQNTVPFYFNGIVDPPDRPYFDFLLSAEAAIARGDSGQLHENVFEYFKFSLAAHYITVASFIPTDVDNQIRHKIWLRAQPEDLEKMWDLVLSARTWETSCVSTRLVTSPKSGEAMSGHNGEWFSVAVAGYATASDKNPEKADEYVAAIVGEIDRQFEIYADFRQPLDSIKVLCAATVIAHNLGDLNRVIETWTLPETDALVVATGEALKRWHSQLEELNHLNTTFMAPENSRHYALRAPKCLRQHQDLLLPFGPFFDDWGRRVARHDQLETKDVAEVVEALIDGWLRYPNTIGYSRALRGIVENFRGGISEIEPYLPRRKTKELRTGKLRTLYIVPQDRFEAYWRSIPEKLIKKTHSR